jgi:hypothetical protein
VLLLWSSTFVPLIEYPSLQDAHNVAPAELYVLFRHCGHVLPLLYRPATQVLTVHKLETVLADQDGVVQLYTPSIPQDTVQPVEVLVPVPDVVVPAVQNIQPLAPSALCEPVAHLPSHELDVRKFPAAP